jgi:hypothetical protein
VPPTPSPLPYTAYTHKILGVGLLDNYLITHPADMYQVTGAISQSGEIGWYRIAPAPAAQQVLRWSEVSFLIL